LTPTNQLAEGMRTAGGICRAMHGVFGRFRVIVWESVINL